MGKKTAKDTGVLSGPGAQLRALRIERSLTMEQLAETTGIPHSTLSKLENGKMRMTYEKLVRLGAGLQVDIGLLLQKDAGEAPMPSPGPVGMLR